MSTRPSIAIVVPGGFGTGKNKVGIPSLEGIVSRLSSRYDVVVFQLFRINSDYRPEGFEVVEISSSRSFLRMLKFLIRFQAHHRRKQFAAIHGFWALPCGFLSVLAGKVWRLKSIVSIVGGDAIALPSIHYGQLNTFLSKTIVFLTLRHANKVVALTQYLVENLRKAGFERKGIEIIPWGVHADLFFYRGKTSNETIHFLHVGNLHPVKDQTTLLRAYKLIHEQVRSDLTIVGEGVAKADLLDLINELQLENSVFLKSPVPHVELPKFYYASDILLHTSLSEGQAVVVAEAMSAGVLVCGTRVGLIYDLEHCCVAVPVGDYKALATETLRFLGDDKRMDLLRYRAFEWTKVHTIDWTAERLGELYSSTG